MPREYRNFNNVGKVSGLLFLLLTFLAVNPIANSSAFAEEDVSNDADGNYFETGFSDSGSSEDTDDIASLDDTASTVNISFSPASAATSLSPTTSTGQSAQLNVLATVSVQNSGGYSVYLKGNSINLVGQSNSSNYIPGATSAKTYANMDTNTWGYYAKEGTAVPDTATYKAVSVSGNGEKIVENTNKKIFTDTKNIMLSFAVKINDEKPADTYKNTITMSVISSPIQVAIDFGIETMQEMTSAICTNAKDNDKDGQISGQLRDTRDGKYYWVSKLADGECWMTQNLDLDLNAGTLPLTSATSDVSANWTPGDAGKNPAYTETTVSSATIYADNTGQRSWSLGNYIIINPTKDTSCGTKLEGIEACSGNGTKDRFKYYATPTSANGDADAHYILGNYYQWNAATAGTGGTITSGHASSSICPKGWRLPTSNNGEFQALTNSIGSDIAVALTSPPYYFVRGGWVEQNTSGLLYGPGNYGYYWSSTPNSDGNKAYGLYFFGTASFYSGYSYTRQYGYPIRCIAR